MKTPVYIAFEGIEGCGKTTQASRLVASLRLLDAGSVLTRETGGTDIGALPTLTLTRSPNLC
jgi:dTMP kinase